MYVIHQHPSAPECQQDRSNLQALYCSCLLALQRYRQTHAPVLPGAVHTR